LRGTALGGVDIVKIQWIYCPFCYNARGRYHVVILKAQSGGLTAAGTINTVEQVRQRKKPGRVSVEVLRSEEQQHVRRMNMHSITPITATPSPLLALKGESTLP